MDNPTERVVGRGTASSLMNCRDCGRRMMAYVTIERGDGSFKYVCGSCIRDNY